MKKNKAQAMATILHQRGLSLIELMVSLTIGLILLAGLSLLFAEASRSHREFSEASKQIENGRFALQLLTDDMHVAGFYGRFSDLSTIATPVSEPDPCEVTSTTTLHDSLPIHIQGYKPTGFATRPVVSALCAPYLTTANLQPGSDVFVIRRADTSTLAATDIPIANEAYIQASWAVEIEKGSNGSAIGIAQKADGSAATILNKDGSAAPIRKYHVHVYFVAPCSVPSGAGSICTGANDDGGKPIPTLKRLELTSVGGTTVMNVVSLVEGIEMLKIDYGVDSDMDGSPNSYLRVPATIPADWVNVVGANLYILSRNPQLTAGYTDAKSYAMGLAGNYAPGGSYKRHVYNTSVRLSNPSMRREIP